MIKKNKNILIFLSVGIVLIVSMFFGFNKKEEYKELPRVKLKDSINTSGLAIMVESEYKSGKYNKLDSTIFPTDGFTLNKTKSGCVDKNGKSVDALIYNESDKTISIKTKQSIYCYLYYDNIFKGKGTKDAPYQINYIEDLVELSNSVNNDQNIYENKYFELMRDLNFKENESYMNYNNTGFGDINGVSEVEGIKDELTNPEGKGWTPIGSTDIISFQGIFDGKDKTLSNIYINNSTASASMGLFGVLKNATISNLKINGTIKSSVNANMGSIVGRVYGKSTFQNIESNTNVTGIQGSGSIGGIIGSTSDDNGNFTLTNLINRGTIKEGNSTAGIIAWADGINAIIEDCHNYGEISQTGSSSRAGGIIGATSNTANITVKINNSSNEGNISTLNRSGGIVGLINSETLDFTITKSFNTGKITGNRYSGGLIGYASGSTYTITESYNNGTILGNSYSGGLVAYVSKGTLNINNSSNEGKVSISGSGYSYLGGLIGYAYSSVTEINVMDSHNTGEITEGSYTGGLIGYNQSTNSAITRCYNEGTITGNSDTGGLMGYARGTCTITESYNTGEITGNSDTGGLIGEVAGTYTITKSYNNGTISGKGYTGGLIGFTSGTSTITESYNTGEITGNSRAGGIIGYRSGSSSAFVLNTYNTGNVLCTGESSSSYSAGIGNLAYGNLTIINSYNSGAVSSATEANAGIATVIETLSSRTLKIYNAYNRGTITGTNANGIEYHDSRATFESNYTYDMPSTGQEFVDTLNSNIDKIDLSSIDSSLAEYTLCRWKLGESGYPELDC